jgi:hypothetical protein
MHSPQFPTHIRTDLADSIEDIGQAMALLRESQGDLDMQNEPGAKITASDALEIISKLEAKFSGLAAQLSTFSEN